MISYIWPIALVVIANTAYQICTKSVPGEVDPLASLSVTYLVGAAFSVSLYFALNRSGNLLREWSRVNWASVVLGVSIVGLEVGFIYAYKAGWEIGRASVVQSAFLAVVLLFVGLIAYHEAITWNKLLGMLVCLAGLVLINLK